MVQRRYGDQYTSEVLEGRWADAAWESDGCWACNWVCWSRFWPSDIRVLLRKWNEELWVVSLNPTLTLSLAGANRSCKIWRWRKINLNQKSLENNAAAVYIQKFGVSKIFFFFQK